MALQITLSSCIFGLVGRFQRGQPDLLRGAVLLPLGMSHQTEHIS